MTSDSLGPPPEPTAEEPELHPGGIDSAEDPRYGTTFDEATTPDPRPEDNPAIEDVLPDEVTAPDDKPQDSSDDDADAADSADADSTDDASASPEPTD